MTKTIPIYPTEEQIAELVLGPGRVEEWRGLAVVLEREGMPQLDPMFGRRNWEAVQWWFRMRSRIGTMTAVGGATLGKVDGEETCPPRKRPDLSSGPVATVHRLHTGPRDETS